MFSPRFIFSALWLTQVLLHVIFHGAFVPFTTITWVAIGLVLLFFNFGTLLVPHLGHANEHPTSRDKYTAQTLFRLFIYVYPLIAAYAGYQIYSNLSQSAYGELTGALVRQMVVTDFTTDRVLYGFFKVFYVGVGLSIFLLALSRHLSRTQMIMVLLIGVASAVATTGRLYLLLFFVASIALMYRSRVISIRFVFYAGLVFVLLFFSLAILLSKGEGDASIGDSIYWNAQVYIMSSVSCFNDYVITNAQHMDGGALLPNPVREALSLFGLPFPPKPVLLPFAEVPVYCNTYTVLFPLFHDGGFVGVCLGALFLGIFHQALYVKYKTSARPVWWYFYAISLYPLVMSIFEDAYFSSPGFWLLLWIPPLGYWVVSRCHFRKSPLPDMID